MDEFCLAGSNHEFALGFHFFYVQFKGKFSEQFFKQVVDLNVPFRP